MIKIWGAPSPRRNRPLADGPVRPRLPLLAAVLLLLLAPAAGEGPVSLAALLSPLSPALAAATAAPAAAQAYTCPMHPHYISDHPGTCPICGMDLVPAKGSGEPAASSDRGERAAVAIAPETIQTMGVRTAKAATARFGRQLRAYGVVKENERLQEVLNSRLEGWVEELSIRAAGDPVKKGDLLFRIYSPELFVTQRDYLTTLAGGDRERQKAAALRLRSYGVQSRVLQQLEQRREAMMAVPFYAERDGVVARIEVQTGGYVERGGMIAMIQDYSSVWLVASMAEQDIGLLAKDAEARVTFPTLPGFTASARIDYIYPTIDSKSRTGQVRLVIDNRDGRLRPGTYADVTFEIDARDRLAVPSEALLYGTGGAYAVLAEGDGRFRPRAVKAGLVVGDRTEIVDGLAAGDTVVTSGQFLIDSESALRESFAKMQPVDAPLAGLVLGQSDLAILDHLIDAALYLHEAQTDGYAVEAKQLDAARAVRTALWPRYGRSRLAPVLSEADAALAAAQQAKSGADTLAALDRLVQALRPWLVEGRPQHYRAKGVSLFEDRAGRRLWLQLGAKPDNPYGKGAAAAIELPAAAPAAAAAPASSATATGGVHAH